MNIDKNKFTFDLQRFDSAFSGGDGSETNPYQISSVADLQQLSTDVKNGNSYEDKCFKLMANLDLSGVANWTPIGNQKTSAFRGTFDGNNANYTISNVTVNRSNVFNSPYDLGLFGYNNGTIKNVTLLNVNITNSNGNNHGGLVGFNVGTVDSCIVTGTVAGCNFVGGIVGNNDTSGKVKNCTVDAQVNGNSNVGGLVGYNYYGNRTVIQNNTFHSNAGAVGKDFSSMTSNNNRVYALPLDGVTAKLMNGDEYKVTIGYKTYYKPDAILALTLDITSNDDFAYITGFKGLTKNSDGSFIYTIGTALEFVGYAKIGSLGFDTTDNSYTISTREQLEEFRDYVNSGHDCAGLKFKLTEDLNLDSIANWTPIGNVVNDFKGTFDGDEHTISNLKITGNKIYQGLFGFNGKGGTIKNVSLVNANISGNGCIGGIAGTNWGTIDNCVVEGTISGDRDVGGIVGNNNEGTVKDSSAFMTVRGNRYVGAIVGYNSNGTFSGNEYASNVGDKTGSIKWLTLPTGITVTNVNAADKVTVGGTDYYKPNTTVKLTLDITSNNDFAYITGIKGLTKNSDGSFDYTIGATLEFDGYAKIGSLAFDSATNTYTIADKNDLQSLADFVAAGNTCAGYKFKLGDNISGVDFHIGTSGNMFAGTFDGDGKTITVAYTATDDENNYTDGGALFNYVDGATIQKLTVDGTINTAEKNAAGLISHSYGNTTIDNYTSSVTINSTVSGEGNHGGIVGVVDGGKLTVSNSKFDGSFIGSSTSHWGGFVGWNSANLEITDGFFAPATVDINTNQSASFARNSNNITDSFCTKTLGTLQGEQIFAELNLPEGVTATYVSGETITIDNKTYYKPGATFKLTATDNYGEGYEGYTFKAGNNSATRESDGVYNLVLGNSDKVEFVGYAKIGSLGFDKSDNSYTIATREQLEEFRDYVNSEHDCNDCIFKLTDNIDLSEVENWTPIGNYAIIFGGTFDGDGHTISNLKITGNEAYRGLFGCNIGTIKNISLVNADISGNWDVGGIVGTNWRTIENCAVEGTISGNYNVGGLVGNNYGTVNDNFAAVTVGGNSKVGAIVGNNNGGNVNGNAFCSDAPEKTGATKYYALNLPAGVTANYTGDNNLKKTVGDKIFYKPGATFNLTLDKTNADLVANYAKVSGFKNASLIEGTNNYSFTLDENGTGIQIDGVDWIKGLSYVKDSTGYVNYYKLSTSADWQLLCDFVNGTGKWAGNPHDCAGTTFEFTRDISTKSTLNNFAGTIDGNGYKLTNNAGTTFKTLNNATISNLEIGGSYLSVNAAGLATETIGNTTLSNITVSANLKNVSTDYSMFGGLVGKNSGTLTIADSKFSGYIESGNASQVGGFVGDNAGTLTITNGIFIPTGLDIKGNAVDCATFANGDNVTISGSTYYATPLGTQQGERIFSGLDLPEGITANYTGGTRLTFDGKTYYKKGTTFELVGEVADGYKLLAGAGSNLTRNDDGTYNFEFNDSPQVSLVNASEIDGLTLENGYYLISSVENLITLRDYVNSGYDCKGLKFRQTTDLDLSGIANWTPIGGADYFNGTFDGQGYKISNLTITGGNRVGLFGWNRGTIKNISLVNANISGNEFVGGIVGYNWRTIENCAVEGTISGDWYVGGIVGKNSEGTVKDCFVDNTVRGNTYGGAIVGYNNGTYSGNEYCSDAFDNTGATRLYKLNMDAGISIVTDAPPSDRRTFNGTNYYKAGATVTLDVTGTYNGAANAPTYLRYGDKLCNKDNNISLTIDGNTDLKLYGHANFNNINYNAATGYYEIDSTAGFYELVEYSRNHDCKGYKFKLTNDIDARAGYNIGAAACHFKGTFDGDGHTISLYKFAATIDNMSLFKFIEDATIKNLTVSGDFHAGDTKNAGGIVSQSFGTCTIDKCVANVSIKSGTDTVGGIVAVNNGKLNITDSKFTGSLSGNIEQFGGFVGDNKGNLTISDGIFAPSTVSTAQSAAVFANGKGICNIENSCYTRAVGTVQGNEVCIMSNLPEGITAELVSGEEIIVGGKTYYKPGTQLKLTIGDEFNYSLETLTLSAGDNELAKNDDGTYTLTLQESANIAFDAQVKIGSAINDGTGIRMHYLEYDATGGYFKIQSVNDLKALAEYVNDGHKCKGLTFKLINDINVGDVTDWKPIAQKIAKGNVLSAEFAGTFDGQGYTIRNVPLTNSLTVDGGTDNTIANDYRGVLGVGLFGTIGTGGFVKDLNVTGKDNENNTWTDGGLFVGRNNGTIDNCTVYGKCGGFVNLNTGTIKDCVSIMTGTASENRGGFAASAGGNFIDNLYVHIYSTPRGYFSTGGTRLTKYVSIGNTNIKVASGEAVITNGKLYYNTGSAITFTFDDDFVAANKDKVLKIGNAVLGTISNRLTYTFPNNFNNNDSIVIGDNDSLIVDDAPTDAANVITINNVNDLKNFRDRINNGKDYSGTIVKLTADIDLSGESNWTPIGDSINFRGTFDGDGHTISNLKITGNETYQGLFGFNGKGGTIKNVNLINANVSGGNNVGGFVGCNYGTIENCAISGTVSGNKFVGGLVGYNCGTVNNNFAATKVNGTGSTVGAVIGSNPTGTCSGNEYISDTGDNTGASKWIELNALDGVTINTDAANQKTIDGKTYYKPGATFTITTTNDMTGKMFKSGYNVAAYDSATSSYNITLGNSPIEIADIPSIGSMFLDIATNSYFIKDADDLQALANHVNTGRGSAGLTFKLTADIDLSGKEYTPIGQGTNWFKGTFDGQGHTISNLTITGDYCVGLFGKVDNGTVQNVNLLNVNISGNERVGGIVGYNDEGTVKDCFVEGTLSSSGQIGAIAGYDNRGNFNNNGYCMNVDDWTGATKYYVLNLPEGVTANYVSGETKTFGGTTYYGSGATFNLSVGTNANFISITGLSVGGKELTKTGDTYSYTLEDNATIDIIGVPTIEELRNAGATYNHTDKAYQISTKEQLQALATYVNGGHDCNGLTFKLTEDIDLDGVNWIPIGDNSKQFKGTFDGDGHTINNLTVTGGDNVGLFGYIRDGTIKNVSLVNANIGGNDCIGGIVGCNYGTIDNCTVEGTISGQQYVGGIVGLNPGRIKNSFTNAQVSGNSYVGAVVGLKSERLEDSVKYVQVSGGYWVAVLVGIIVGDFSGNYYVQGSDNCASKIGILNLPEGVTATFNSGGGDDVTFVGKKYYLQGSNLLLSVDKTTAGYHDVKGLRIGDTDLTADANGRYALVFDGQNTNVTINGDPIIDGFTYSNGVYLIQSYTDLGILSRYVAAGHNCAGLKFKVTAEGKSNTHYDIQNSQYQIGTEETPFAGTFDGNGKTIELLDLTIDALFGYIDGATIKNLKITSWRESGNDKVSYSKGIAANASGTNTISDCVVSSTNIESGGFVYNNSGTLTIRNSVFNGSIYSGDGFVGSNTGTLRVRGSMFAPSSVPENYSGNAYAGGTVNIANSCYTAGTGNGATKAFKFTLPANTNLANDNSLLTFDGEQYIAQGTDLKLTVDAAQFTQFASFKVDGNDVAGKNGVYTVTIGETYPTITAAGRVKIADLLYDSADDCYLIESAEELQALADFISAGNTLTNSFKLTHDIDISGKNIQLGTSANPFAGTFNGNGYAITTDRALFDYVSGATINNLMITGTLLSGNGFVNNVSGTVNINNSVFAPAGDFSGNAFASGGTITNSYYTKGTAGDGATKVHTLSGLPRQLSLICADADKFTFGDTTYYKSGAELTFTRDGEERRIVDGVTVGGVAATKVGDAYKVTLGNDATDFAVEGSWHIQLNGAGDTYTNRDDNISILGGAGNDSVDNFGKNVTITAGEGNDTIKLRNGNNSVKLDGFGVGDVIEFDGTIDSLGSEGYNESDKKAVIISNHVWTTLDGVKFSEDGLVWSFDAANRKAQYGIQKLEGVYLDENNKIQYRMNEIKPEDMYVELSGIGADFAIQTDNLDGFGGLQAGTETIVLNGEHFKGGDGITVTSNERGYAFALIDSVSGVHFTGSDKGEYIYVDESDVTLTGGGGADTIKLGLNVQKITVTDMGTDDRIYFPGTINKENIEIVNGSLVAHWYGGYVSDRAITIGGINDSIATNLSGWRDTDNGKAYYIGNANGFGADEHGMYIGYVEANDLTPIIEFNGLHIVSNDSPRVDDSGSGYDVKVQINPENFAGNELKILQEQAGIVVETSYDDFTGKTLVGSNANYIKHDEYAGDSEIGDIIENHGSNLVIMCGGGDDSIDNYASDVTIDGGSGNNNINLKSGGNISVSGGTGDNQIYISTNEAVTINTAQGNNTIHGILEDVFTNV